MAKGTIPVCLVAHLDTVYDREDRSDLIIFHDQELKVLCSPDGIAGDDRCGVYAIIQLIEKGYRPHILLTMGEEIGGAGAYEVASKYLECPLDVDFFIEIDRQGYNDAVFYQCGSANFRKYICKFGFKAQEGTFTDIRVLMSFWNICSVNLSAGYYNEHFCGSEYIVLSDLEEIIEKVSKILDDNNSGNRHKFTYTERNVYANWGI